MFLIKHVRCMDYMKNHTYWLEDLERRDHLKHLGLDRWIIFRWILNKLYGKVRTGFTWLTIASKDGLLLTR
jgi:hypothetical protein